jgi:aspartyl-tRNA(Asn)/glutamyl-tRNA(Gln) amidotransferase subunit B
VEYDTIICFEIHVELKTKTKLFCACATEYGAPPNVQVCPVCTGQPGSLPVLNKKAVELCVMAGKALHCSINPASRFARKNYFYPDLPKGYQISQYERPLCENGYLEITADNGHPYAVGIRRIHLEEDAGKLVHSASSFGQSDYSLVDYNRSGIPLIEIVADHTRNPLRSTREAQAYLETLRQVLTYTEVSDCIIEKGQFRCDVNISLRPTGSHSYGNRAEIKNLSSFKSVVDALDYEIKRQVELLQSAGQVSQETRLFDEKERVTVAMRTKEDAPDYRYFPDPDLVDIEIDRTFIEDIEGRMPALPEETVDRLTNEFGIRRNTALILARDKNIANFFVACAEHCEDRQKLCRWIIKELFMLLNRASISIQACSVSPRDFAELINKISRGEISDKMGRAVLEEMFETGGTPERIIAEKDLKLVDDTAVLQRIVDEVFTENPQAVSQIARGMTKPVDFLIGQVMKKTDGRAPPRTVRDLIRKRLGSGLRG